MDGILKAVGAVLAASIISLLLQRQGKEYAAVLVIGVCAMISCLALSYIKPVISFLQRLQSSSNLDGEMLKILLKAVGVGLISEISGAVCSDMGNASLNKAIQLLSAAIILWLSLPLLEQTLELIERILEGI